MRQLTKGIFYPQTFLLLLISAIGLVVTDVLVSSRDCLHYNDIDS